MSISSLGGMKPSGPSGHGTPKPRRARELTDAAALELDRRSAPLLACGSLLAHGSVGLNAARLVYAAHGIRAVELPTILLSVMPHYASAHDLPIPAHWLAAALGDLTAAGALDDLRCITAGYFASPEQPAAIAGWYAQLPRATRPPLVLDPTLGDADLGFYTDPRVAEAIRTELLPLATGVIPNLFELAQLTGTSIGELDSQHAIAAAARSLMNRNTEWVVVTGVTVPSEPGEIGELLVRRDSTSPHTHPVAALTAKGLGDTFTAALLAALLRGEEIAAAVDSAAAEVLARAAAPRANLAAP